jgi:hypothetical protein
VIATLRHAAIATLLTLSTLYPTIYLHELAHAATAVALRCKEDGLAVDMSPILVWSFGGAIDYACLAAGPAWATAAVDGAGIAVNLLLMFAGWGAAAMVANRTRIALWLYAFAAANYVEAFSYLVANTAIPRSDMLAVLAYLDIHNLMFAAVATAAAIVVGRPLFGALIAVASRLTPPRRAITLAALAAGIVAAGMFAARLPLTDSSAPPGHCAPPTDCPQATPPVRA